MPDDDENSDYEPEVITAGEDREVELALRDERTTESDHVTMPDPDDETDWPRGWTARERVETVFHDHGAPDSPAEIADEADVGVETAREVVEQIADRDYSDTRWDNDD